MDGGHDGHGGRQTSRKFDGVVRGRRGLVNDGCRFAHVAGQRQSGRSQQFAEVAENLRQHLQSGPVHAVVEGDDLPREAVIGGGVAVHRAIGDSQNITDVKIEGDNLSLSTELLGKAKTSLM